MSQKIVVAIISEDLSEYCGYEIAIMTREIL